MVAPHHDALHRPPPAVPAVLGRHRQDSPHRATDLATAVARALRASGLHPLQEAEVVTHGGTVILRGWVPSYHLKQLAQAHALAVPGVREVRNELTVLPHPAPKAH
jgi:osmotically-inducible protein OsmY